ncbi:hypothetical protein GGR57DRAFT_503082 [Xylariaceae sp. FL1272]|nr:hypothetical protein GGR57DRAFT_503082 [Xylariaceae sp. FL1272]
MLFTTHSITLLFMATRVQAASEPECVETCIDNNPTSSWCDGDETGEELADCTCQSIYGSLMLDCIKKCPEADQITYASNLPGTCGATLFPDLDIPTTTTTASSSAATQTSEETQSSDSADGSETDAAAGLMVPAWTLVASLLGIGIIAL